jgi:rhodanese-related sulfurtransferase
MKALIKLSGIQNIGIIVCGIILLLSGCKPASKEAETNSVNNTITNPENRKLSAAKAYEMMATDTDLVVLDVRTPEEFEAGHIINAFNVDFRAEDFKDNVQKLDKEKTYLVYCMGGHRSNQAQLLMDSLDFRQVYDLIGGFKQWSEADMPHQ